MKNTSQLISALWEAAKRSAPSEAIPYAFEKRVMAHLPVRQRPDGWAISTRFFSRAACSGGVLATLLAGASLGLLGDPSDETDSAPIPSDVAAGMAEEGWGDSW